MATATADPKTTDALLLLLADGPQPVKDIAGKVDKGVLALAVARGEVEFGKTKYVITGNPASAVTVHNGVNLPSPAVVIEGGVDWPLPDQRWRPRLADVLKESLPLCGRYQKYQLEVCVQKEKDLWEWLPEGETPDGRDSRYARRDVKRDEAERSFCVYVRLSERGALALTV